MKVRVVPVTDVISARAFIGRPRCIYTGIDLVPDDPELQGSLEHIIPLSLGGSNSFTTPDVSRSANNRAGNEIDDKVASLFAVTILRNQLQLAGHRGKVPDVRMEGTFLDMASQPSATMVVESNGSVAFNIKGMQSGTDGEIKISGQENWVAKMLAHRLRQARHRGGHLLTPFGDITDEEDIEIAVAIADGENGSEFKTQLSFDLRAHQRALQHFAVKVGMCLGHQVFGPEWTFGPDGLRLRRALFPGNDKAMSKIRGTLYADLAKPVEEMLDLAPDRHSLAVFRFNNTGVALIALFGGRLGVAAIGLSRSAGKYRASKLRHEPEGHLYHLSNLSGGKPTFQTRSLDQMVLNVSPFF